MSKHVPMKDTDHFYEVPVCTECIFDDNDEKKGTKVLKILPVDIVPDGGRVSVRNAVDLKTGALLYVADSRMVSFNRMVHSGC